VSLDSAPTALSIPRFGYGLMIGLVSLGTVLLGLGTTWFLGGSQPSILLVAGALAFGAIVSLIPALMKISAEFWGVAVMLAGVARGLIVLGVVFVATENNPDLSRRAMYLGAMVGTVLALIVETTAAVMILSKIERAKAAAKTASSKSASNTNQPGRSMAPAEHS
jgi:hypothetical protein